MAGPTSVNPYLWYKADALALNDGDAVATWTDSSGNGRDATQATATNKPTFKTNIVNGLPILRFDGTDDYLSIPDLSALTAATGVIVLKLSADPPTGQKDGLWQIGSDGTADTRFPFSGDGKIYDQFGTTLRQTTVDPSPNLATTFRRYCVVSTGTWTSFLDNSQLFTSNPVTVGFTTTPKLGRGPFASGSVWLMGDVAEFILYSSGLSAADRTDVDNYLVEKYLSVPGVVTVPVGRGV